MVQLTSALAAVCFAATAIAHPGEHHDHNLIRRQINAREHHAHKAKSSLDACAGNLKAREVTARSIARRAEVARSLRQKRGIASSMFLLSYAMYYQSLTSRRGPEVPP